MKKLIALTLSLILICSLFTACKKEPENAPVEGNTLRFSNLVENMKPLEGQKVDITGYMSTAASADNNIFYLMCKPFNNSPFAADNSTVLEDTIAVHTRKGKNTGYTDSLITVTGTLVFGEHSDTNGKSYTYYIKNAVFVPADPEELSGNAKLWQDLSGSGITDEVNKMFEYVYFLSCWTKTTYTVGDSTNYYTPEKALRYIELDSGKFNYGFKEGYFDSLEGKVNSLSEGNYDGLLSAIQKAEALADKAYKALKNGEYESVPEYSGSIGDGGNQYLLNDWEAIENEYNSLYESYSSWLEGWEI